MDTFMDKLAQRLTAQEMIKANTTAETEELNQLRGQVNEYQDCLRQMRLVMDQMSRLVNDKIAPDIYKLVEAGVLRLSDAQMDTMGLNRLLEECRAQVQRLSMEGVARLENAKVDTTQINRLVEESRMQLQRLSEESVTKLKNVQVDTEGINQLLEEGRAQLQKASQENGSQVQKLSTDGVAQMKKVSDEGAAQMKKVSDESAAQMKKVSDEGTAQLKKLSADSTAQMQRAADESVAQMQKISEESLAQMQKISEESAQKLQEMKQDTLDPEGIKKILLDGMQESNDNVHRECVKVYRNVQAIVVEENGKQTENINETTKLLKGKLKMVFSISIGALACSALGLILQLLSALHVF
ncbi:MAG: hypothetical protein NC417_12410 [Candidatus Gastranaerophilales bacterium]|nr:hypothetical protein [Candidatus Gastranaerophilales bacterium]